MIIGRANKRILLQYPSPVADGRGGRKTNWESDRNRTVWAEVKKPIIEEVLSQSGAVSSILTREISIRQCRDISRGWRVVCDGKIYEVVHTYDINRDATILVCKEVVK